MLNETLIIRSGDTIPAVRVTDMIDSAGSNLSFVAGDTGAFTMVDDLGNVVVDAQPVVLDLNTNSLTYSWGANETDEAGNYRAYVTISFNNGTTGTWPNQDYYNIFITPPLPSGYAISVARVRDGFNTKASEEDIAAFISIVDQADACLTNNSIPTTVGRQLKILATRHMLVLAQTSDSGGKIISERAISGASRSFQQSTTVRASHYGDLLKQLDKTGCVLRLIENNAPIMFRSVGPKSTQIKSERYS
jgi:hypothetical protein